MSPLKFSSFCGECFAPIAQGSGTVLSCGDFLCNNCTNALDRDKCPVCHTTGIRSASLKNPPDEVGRNMADPSELLENTFNILKFQVSHYKDMLLKAAKRIDSAEDLNAKLNSKIVQLERKLEAGANEASKRMRYVEPRNYDTPNNMATPNKKPSFHSNYTPCAESGSGPNNNGLLCWSGGGDTNTRLTIRPPSALSQSSASIHPPVKNGAPSPAVDSADIRPRSSFGPRDTPTPQYMRSLPSPGKLLSSNPTKGLSPTLHTHRPLATPAAPSGGAFSSPNRRFMQPATFTPTPRATYTPTEGIDKRNGLPMVLPRMRHLSQPIIRNFASPQTQS